MQLLVGGLIRTRLYRGASLIRNTPPVGPYSSLVRIHFIFVMSRWTGLAPWEFESPFPGSLISTFLTRQLSFQRQEVYASPLGPLIKRQS